MLLQSAGQAKIPPKRPRIGGAFAGDDFFDPPRNNKGGVRTGPPAPGTVDGLAEDAMAKTTGDLQDAEPATGTISSSFESSELERPISENVYFGGYAGPLPGDSYLSAARRVLKNLKELEEQMQARAKLN